jgi:hypothetical protein
MAVKLNSSSGGSVTLQEPTTASNYTLTVPAQTGTIATTVDAGNYYAFKNRIINGNMAIDQRNAGASVTANDGIYTLDRWTYSAWQNGKGTIQQNAGSVTTPAGFSKYLGFTSTSAYTVGAGENFGIQQRIEGFNFADLNWGTASASTVTLSFQVYSSLTGTFGGAIQNSAQNRSYPFSFTISSANTWTQISITIAGDTTGTWVGATNGIGAILMFNLGAGASYSGTANTWQAGAKFAPTGATAVVGTNGATFYITGVQLEKGSVATSFDYRPYGTELQLCQRYCQVYTNSDTANQRHSTTGWATGTTNVDASFLFKATMRTSPSVSIDTIGNLRLSDGAAASTPSSYAILGAVTNSNQALVAFGGSGLTTYRNYWVEGNGAAMNTAKITFSAEL